MSAQKNRGTSVHTSNNSGSRSPTQCHDPYQTRRRHTSRTNGPWGGRPRTCKGAQHTTRPKDPGVSGRTTVVFIWCSPGPLGQLVASPLRPSRPVVLGALKCLAPFTAKPLQANQAPTHVHTQGSSRFAPNAKHAMGMTMPPHQVESLGLPAETPLKSNAFHHRSTLRHSNNI